MSATSAVGAVDPNIETIRSDLKSVRDGFQGLKLASSFVLEQYSPQGALVKTLTRKHTTFLTRDAVRVDVDSVETGGGFSVVRDKHKHFEATRPKQGRPSLTELGGDKRPKAEGLNQRLDFVYLQLPFAAWTVCGISLIDEPEKIRLTRVSKDAGLIRLEGSWLIRGTTLPGKVWLDERFSHAIVRSEMKFTGYTIHEERQFRLEPNGKVVPIKLVAESKTNDGKLATREINELETIDDYKFVDHDFSLAAFSLSDPDEKSIGIWWALVAFALIAAGVGAYLAVRKRGAT